MNICRNTNLISIDKKWLDPQYHHETNSKIKKPDELENEMDQPNGSINEKILDRIQGSILGLALGDALGAHVEFRPRQFLVQHPVADLGSGGTWGLSKGQVGLFLSLFTLKEN